MKKTLPICSKYNSLVVSIVKGGMRIAAFTMAKFLLKHPQKCLQPPLPPLQQNTICVLSLKEA
jgi:hypothetical protein